MSLLLHADARGVGPLYWDERNEARQDFYALLNASARLSYDAWNLTLWGRNLTDASYSTFYFVSMKNRFLQQGKPLQWGATLTWNF
jgi:outer membrane receptor protein involved in Fe transport